jgi:hypothetical protein
MATADRSISSVLHDIVGNVQDIVRSELRLARTELTEELAKARNGAMLLGVGTLMVVFSVLFVLVMGRGRRRRSRRRRDRRDLRRCRHQAAQVDARRSEDDGNPEGERRMGKTSDEIVNDIDQTRGDLKSNLEELESRLKAVTDWRVQVGRHPAAMVAAALVGGALLSLMTGKRRSLH